MTHEKIRRRGVLGSRAANPLLARKTQMALAVGGDHAGLALKAPETAGLRRQGHTVKDCGAYSPEPVDCPDIAQKLCDDMRSKRGILGCGAGVGASITGNKGKCIRVALWHGTYSAHQCAEHDHGNLVCVGASIIGSKVAEEILAAYLNAKFGTNDRRSVRKLSEMEKR